MKKIEGNIIDLFARKVFKGEICIDGSKIISITEKKTTSDVYILPGLIDSHVHIESSMLIPSVFSKLAIQNGTVAVVTDPHEIANVLGMEGVKFMIQNSEKTPLKTFYCAPSCVPATPFETSGAELSSSDIETLFKDYHLKVLGEMMNYPGVIYNDKEVHAKLEIAKKYNAVIDGHIPGIFGEDLKKYVEAGISTDHECFSIEEAIEKINLGMKVLIREGSAAKNFDALYPLISKFNKMVMLCTDDSHPDDLIKYGHINKILKLGQKQKIDMFDMLYATCVNPVEHYNLDVGLLRENDFADFIVVDNLEDFNILETYINGNPVYSQGRILFNIEKEEPINNFGAQKISIKDISVEDKKSKIKIIEVIDKELITKSFEISPKVSNGQILTDPKSDILKIVVYNRYKSDAKPQVGFINGFDLKTGALATSIAHDSHNIIAVGTSDEDIVKAINEIIDLKGGLTYVNNNDFYTLQLEFAGLMTQADPTEVAEKYGKINSIIKANGCILTAPFMTLSFMALLVIPQLKIGDKGLFDVEKFEFTDLYC